MKISLRWINEFVDVSEFFSSPQKLVETLTYAGFEIEDLKNYSQKYRNFVIGEILDFSKHSGAHKLQYCQVGAGGKKNLSIVCGAKNFKKKDKVVLALPEAIVKNPKKEEWIKISSSKIRGLVSEGMLCSEEELDLDSNLIEMLSDARLELSDQSDRKKSNGILILPQDAEVGKNFSTYFGFDDIVFDVDITPNRSDCLSHLGIAREIAALLNTNFTTDFLFSFKKQNKNKDQLNINKKRSLKNKSFKVQVNKKDLCPCYTGKIIENIQIGSSPAWLSQKLKLLGLSSHNNVVDITNYVMLEMGQPLHAFDLNSLEGNEITVDFSSKGEKFLALNDRVLELTGSELVIRDKKNPIALAGIIGGKNSSVHPKTSDIFLESAYFSAQSVRRSARHFGIETDSSLRFSRGVDPMVVDQALKRACFLIEKYAKGRVFQNTFSESFYKKEKKGISVALDDVEKKLGISVKAYDFIRLMRALNCKIKKTMLRKNKKKISFIVFPPTYRLDLKEDVDLVEEYARLNGYDKILESTPSLRHFPLKHNKVYEQEEKISDFLVREGFFEAINLCFTNHNFQEKILNQPRYSKKPNELKKSKDSVFIKNFLNQETHVMRKSLMPGIIKNCVFNYRNSRDYGRFFEIGKTFFKDFKEKKMVQDKEKTNKHLESKYTELSSLGLIAWNVKRGLWENPKFVPLFYDLKSVLENLFNFLGSDQITFNDMNPLFCLDSLHPVQSQILKKGNKVIGVIGTLHPSLKKEFKLRTDVALAEISDLNDLIQTKKFKFQKPSKFPMIQRDLSFVVSQDILSSSIVSCILSKKIPILKSVDIFDLYQDDKIGKEKYALALKFLFQDKNQTLLESKVSKYQEEIIKDLSQKFSAHLRS